MKISNLIWKKCLPIRANDVGCGGARLTIIIKEHRTPRDNGTPRNNEIRNTGGTLGNSAEQRNTSGTSTEQQWNTLEQQNHTKQRTIAVFFKEI